MVCKTNTYYVNYLFYIYSTPLLDTLILLRYTCLIPYAGPAENRGTVGIRPNHLLAAILTIF